MDTWGPYKEFTFAGCRYFLTIVDDFTRMTWVFLLKFKSDVSKVVPQFVTYIENHFHASVKTIKTDNAQVLCEGQLKLFYLDKGIFHQKSCPHTPQQNGVVERKHRHILDTARALFFQSKLPISF